jgi:hypothetical protein
MRAAAIVLTVALAIAAASCVSRTRSDSGIGDRNYSSQRMPDGHDWQTENLNLATAESYCFGDREANCRRYGRLYTWRAATTWTRTAFTGRHRRSIPPWRRSTTSLAAA